MNVLVTGGAGYIGSHITRHLLRAGYNVTAIDNLIAGHAEAVPSDCLVRCDLMDRKKVEQVLQRRNIEAVIHMAAFALVGESVVDPAKYYQNNIVGSLTLLEAMRSCNVQRIVFSSTTATYGIPDSVPIKESQTQRPINPYGFSKLVVERALADYSKAYGFSFVALRYFNAAGAAFDGDLGEDHDPETHLIPLVLRVALGQAPAITILGDDYPTPDGTCIRDYIHVEDLANAHVRAVKKLGPDTQLYLNLGMGRGFSVKEVIEACREVTGHRIPTKTGPRRPGDPPILIADASLARDTLAWQPQITELREIVDTAWRWHSSHPAGYRTANGTMLLADTQRGF